MRARAQWAPSISTSASQFTGAFSGSIIPIEERAEEEVTELTGRTADGRIETVRVAAEGSPAANPAFDVTPARLVTGLITERGRCPATEAGLAALYPEKA